MKKFYGKIKTVLKQGQNVVLVSVISTSGSTPRGNGARMAVFEDGTTIGTIGGGAVEYASIQVAKNALQTKQSCIREFDLSHGDKTSIGMVCGGNVTVFFQYIEKDFRFCEVIDGVLELLDKNTDSWMITEIADGIAVRTGLYDKEQGIRFLPPEVSSEIQMNLSAQSVWTQGNPSYFIEPLTTAGYAYIFGGGHVAQALVPVIANVGFKPVIYEDREEFVKEDLFTCIDHTILGSYSTINNTVKITSKDYVIVMTRGHQSDFEVLSEVLKTSACYIGVMGSRTKISVTNQRLLEYGFTKEDISRIHTPIGLAIKAQTPAEIAISVAAELILCRAQMRETQ